ncbi:MAG: hypothetical protein SF097_12205 [Acidobacteriota bacterium]|nr:hypothetical protein [Acidobacteriota bacterium]
MTQSATVAEQLQPVTLISAEQQNYSGIVLPPFDPEKAIAVLQSFYEGDPEEQRETFEHLKKALNEERAAGGERLLFVDDNE